MVKVILKQDVPNLGKLGDLVNVRPGYGRNYLIPQGLAVAATEGNVRQIEHQKRLIAQQATKMRAEASDLASRIAGATLTLVAPAGAEGRLFGSITNRDIEEALAAVGIRVDRKLIHLAESVKSVGEHQATVKLGHDVDATVKFQVVPKD
jgi:large subunit ribosomal protein L9